TLLCATSASLRLCGGVFPRSSLPQSRRDAEVTQRRSGTIFRGGRHSSTVNGTRHAAADVYHILIQLLEISFQTELNKPPTVTACHNQWSDFNENCNWSATVHLVHKPSCLSTLHLAQRGCSCRLSGRLSQLGTRQEHSD